MANNLCNFLLNDNNNKNSLQIVTKWFAVVVVVAVAGCCGIQLAVGSTVTRQPSLTNLHTLHVAPLRSPCLRKLC